MIFYPGYATISRVQKILKINDSEEKNMKKILAMLLVAAMIACLFAGCKGGNKTNGDDTNGNSNASADMKVAMVTDYGDITDQSFNQTTYEACKAFCDANSVTFTYYKPAGDSTAERVAMVEAAVANGYNVIVMPGYAFGGTIVEVSELYPDVKFVALDVSAGDILEAGVGEGYSYNPADYDVTEYYNTDNVFCAVYQEELAGYMAGYAAVKLGYKNLGFLGGMAVPAVIRYGYGFVQGVDAAAVEMGIADQVSVDYVYGGQFYGDTDITAYMDTWYSTKGIEVVFACGGAIFNSAAEAAAKVGGKVIGVDVDQAANIDGQYGEGMTVTSAMKGLAPTVQTVLTAIKDGNWSEYVGKIQTLGLVSGTTPSENYVQLPEGSTQWSDSFTQEDYVALVKGLYDGTIKVSNDTTAMPQVSITVDDAGSIK